MFLDLLEPTEVAKHMWFTCLIRLMTHVHVPKLEVRKIRGGSFYKMRRTVNNMQFQRKKGNVFCQLSSSALILRPIIYSAVVII